MATTIPIYSLAKELGIESNRIILACKSLSINAKGATKRLNKEELEQVKNYFETGKNVSEEVVEINKHQTAKKNKQPKRNTQPKIKYFPNRLISKS